MPDTNLNDNMVKLVEYKILTIEREQESFLESGTTIETDDLTGDAFSNARIAEWTKKNPDRIRDPDDPKSAGIRASTLRVYYNVLDRWPKEDLKKDEKEVTYFSDQRKELGELNQSLKKIADHYSSSGGGSSSGGSSKK